MQRADHLPRPEVQGGVQAEVPGACNRASLVLASRVASAGSARSGPTPGSGSSHPHTAPPPARAGLDTHRRHREPCPELRVPGQLPRVLAMRLQPERLPDPMNIRLIQADLNGHRPRRPMRPSFGSSPASGDHLVDLPIGDLAADPAEVHRAGRPNDPRKPVPPLASRIAMNANPVESQPYGAPGRGQHDPRPQSQRLRTRPAAATTTPTAHALLRQLDRHCNGRRHTTILPHHSQINASRH